MSDPQRELRIHLLCLKAELERAALQRELGAVRATLAAPLRAIGQLGATDEAGDARPRPVRLLAAALGLVRQHPWLAATAVAALRRFPRRWAAAAAAAVAVGFVLIRTRRQARSAAAQQDSAPAP